MKAKDQPERPRRMTEAAAWRLMGEAFVRLLRSKDDAHAERTKAAWELAAWLHDNFFTEQQQEDFRYRTGETFDPSLLEFPPPDPSIKEEDIPF